MVYLPTFPIKINYSCIGKYTIHGSSGRFIPQSHSDYHVASVVPGRHRELRHHEEDIRRELRSYTDHGWFTAVARAAKLRWVFSKVILDAGCLLS